MEFQQLELFPDVDRSQKVSEHPESDIWVGEAESDADRDALDTLYAPRDACLACCLPGFICREANEKRCVWDRNEQRGKECTT
jgi:hypothetical protein